MTNAQLAVVRPTFETEETASSHGDRVRALQAETLAVTHDHITALAEAIERMTVLADEIAVGGATYPQSVKDIARRLSQEAPVASRTLRATLTRF
ncbi:hypothetical protein [Brevundimonas aurifodinae]|uniref:Uncharacterized protein n=1 Tax=Brevundimonas aurifodinae TaxID=1508312 RepID=A0ABV1NSW9_9CAUL|nr:MAG: hypothetical protein B7Z42_09720 [Brevundimonas sp. 12-68-7]